METTQHDPFASSSDDDNPFDGESIESMAAEAEPEGFGEDPAEEIGGDPEPASPEPQQEPPVVDREGNRVTPEAEAMVDEALSEAEPEAQASAGTFDPVSGQMTPPTSAEAPTEPQVPPEAQQEEAAKAQEAPTEPESAPDATEAPSASASTPEPETAPETAAPRAPRRRKAGKKDADGPRRYRPLYQTAKGQWTELPLSGEKVADIKDYISQHEGQTWILTNNVDQARRIAYIAAGRPREGIRLVLVAEKSWAPKTIKPRLVPQREALEIS